MVIIFDSEGKFKEIPDNQVCRDFRWSMKCNPNRWFLDLMTAEDAHHLGTCKTCGEWLVDQWDASQQRSGPWRATIKRLFEAVSISIRNGLHPEADKSFTLEELLNMDGWGPWEEHQEQDCWEDYLSNRHKLETWLGHNYD